MEIRAISWKQTISLRQSVLWPNEPPEYCHVEGDLDASHFGVFIDGLLICVASIYLTSNSARLRKFATDTRYQNQGIGSKMLEHIIQTLRNNCIEIFWCDARESAIPFYERFGMQASSERFYKADLPYYKMEVILYQKNST
ncbi:GNAT family N-acetyltransferase [Colwellia sp. Bg11-28]|uniref:GNAT family N-acetyltransferase n=1 Tax=Colwellia sp. Bg11-28 TaxID=2058305 RepID=UPI000C34E8C0|nr:GNAT family N-acetyltransferase [Colwellia sp. Bg11-28]PKH87167.1 GNAT family N-acetyltransferase [Colwellia sp. Bg11-28]